MPPPRVVAEPPAVYEPQKQPALVPQSAYFHGLRYLGQLALTGVAGAAGATLLTLGVVGLLVV